VLQNKKFYIREQSPVVSKAANETDIQEVRDGMRKNAQPAESKWRAEMFGDPENLTEN
jgi:hypothetical protein